MALSDSSPNTATNSITPSAGRIGRTSQKKCRF
jgi:hypothetical protein